jgi:hypothetical protein
VYFDDLMVISENQDALDTFGLYLKRVYPETRTTSSTILDYVGMTFDFTTAGEVGVTMDKCIDDITSECGVTRTKVTPGASVLFDVRDAPKEAKWFHTHVEDTIPGKEGEARVSDSSSLPVYQSHHVRY